MSKNNREMQTTQRMLHAANIAQEVCNSTLATSGRKLYLDVKTADVFFVTRSADGLAKRIPAHKAILAAGSEVFNAMFYGQLQEAGDVKIEDATASIFADFLQFFYVEVVTLSMENVAGVMYLGHKYNVSDCFCSCTQFIKSTLSYQNVCIGLDLALIYDLVDLKERCETMISDISDAVFKSASFLHCDRRVLKHILNMDVLSCSESLVFKLCMHWVKHACKRNNLQLNKDIVRAYLGDAFYDIRFASMNVEEFAVLINEYGDLFTDGECKDIVQVIALRNYQSKIFCTKMRKRPQRQRLLGYRDDDFKTF